MGTLKEKIINFNDNKNNKDLVFENIIYFLLDNNRNNIFQNLFNCFTKEIQDRLINDYENYLFTSKNDDKDIFLYNYIIKLNDIFIEKEEEFIKNGRIIKIDPIDIN